jgi:ATP-binding cassette, subfamily C, bacterial CydD
MAPPNPMTALQNDPAPTNRRSAISRFTRPGSDAEKLLRRAELMTVAASLLWIAQAAAAAIVLADLVSESPDIRSAITGGVAFVLVGIGRAALSHRAGAAALHAAQTTIGRERKMLLEREALRAPLSGGGRSSAEIATLASDKLAMTVPYLTRYRPAMTRARIVPAAIILAALPFSWVAALILMVTGPVIPMFMALVGMAAQEASERQMEEIGSINGLLLERIRALTDLRLLDATGRTIDDFRGAAERLHKKTMRVLAVAFLSSTVLEFFSAIGVALMAVYVGFSLIGQIGFGAWATPLSVGEGIFLLLLAPDFFQPLRDLSASWHDKAQATAVADELKAGEKSPHEPVVGSGHRASRLDGPASIRCDGVSRELSDGSALSIPDFILLPGQSLAITGPSGSGKSTLLALIAGLVAPSSGGLTVAGRLLEDENADGWRARLAFIPQTPHFSHESLRTNLRRFAPDADDARLLDALRAASADWIEARLPRGLDTRLGETGHGVSGGEARRLTIARVLSSDADVILADEPTADLDAETARAVTEALMALKARGKSLIVATHDLELAEHMDLRIDLRRPT